MVTTNFLVPTLRYDTLDITGAATTPGSYAFLDTAGDASSAIGNYRLFRTSRPWSYAFTRSTRVGHPAPTSTTR